MLVAPTYQPNMQSLAQAPTPQEDQERKRRMMDAWKAYRGEFQPPLKVAADQPDDNVISNRCAPIVDKGVSFLFGQVLKIEATDETSETDTDKQDFLKGLWGDDDERMTLLSQMAINGGVCGQVFVRICAPEGQMKFPRLVVLDPLLVRIVTDPEDIGCTLAYVIEYPAINEFQKRQVIARIDPDGLASIAGKYDIDDTWTITNYTRRGQLGVWYQVGEREEWPYPFAPIFTAQNLPNPNEVWGVPDLTPDIIGQNKVLNFIQSNTSRVIKFHGHPKTYATGLSATQINIGVDDLLCLPSPDSKIQNLEMHGNLQDHLNFAAIIRANIDEQSRVPAVALGREEMLPKGNISGVALQLLFQPLIEKTTQKQRLYGCMIRDISRAALVLIGKLTIEEYEDYPIDLHWQSLLPSDDLQSAQTMLVYQQLGVSQYTILSMLDFDPDDEMEKKQAEVKKQQAENPQPEQSPQQQQLDAQLLQMKPDGGK